MPQAEQLLASRCELGEGPLWNPNNQTLYFVDILQSLVHTYHPASGEHKSLEFPDYVCALALRQSGGFLIATRKHLAYWDGTSDRFETFLEVEATQPQARFNDGAVDPLGNYWIGTLDPPNYTSAVYRLKPDFTLKKVIPNTSISNGIDWSPDGATMYFTDSTPKTIYAFDFTHSDAEIDNQRVFTRVSSAASPDGLAVDSEGGVWSAEWDGRRVVRYHPSGEVDYHIDVPTRFVTSLTFGGPALKDLFITTAWNNKANHDSDPAAGNLFHAQVDIPGTLSFEFKG